MSQCSSNFYGHESDENLEQEEQICPVCGNEVLQTENLNCYYCELEEERLQNQQ